MRKIIRPLPYGPNSLVQESRFATLFSVFRLFADPLVITLLIASGISLGLGDPVGGPIIIVVVLLSALLNFFMEFQARHAVEEIRKQVANTDAVLRDGGEQELPIAELVPGDTVSLLKISFAWQWLMLSAPVAKLPFACAT